MNSQIDPKQTQAAAKWKHDRPLISCRFHPDGEYAFTTSEDQTIQRWQLATGEKIQFTAHDSWVRGLTFVDGGQTLVSGGYDGRLVWWPALAEKPEPIRRIDAHAGWIRSLTTSPDGQLIASGGNDNVVRLWNAADGTLVREFAGHAGNVYSTLFHPSGEWVLSGDILGDVRQWETATGKLVRQFDAKDLHTYNGGQAVHFGGVRCLAVSHDGKYLACGGLHNAPNPLGAVHEPLVMLFDWEKGEKVRSQVTSEKLKGVAWQIMFHPTGFLVAASGGSSGGYLLFWQPEQDNEVFKLKLPHLARDLDLHPDGMPICTCHYDGQIQISSMAPQGETKT